MKTFLLAAALGSSVLALSHSAVADPLGGKEPWNFTPQNRPALAVAIKNIEDPGSGGSGAGTIVCGGTSGASGQGATGSGASATANSSCIIINNSDGAIVHNDQLSDGNQSSNSSASSSTHNNSSSGRSIDEVSAILRGNKQGL